MTKEKKIEEVICSLNLVTTGERTHLYPYRTQKLSSQPSMVLGWQRPGRVENRQFEKSKAVLGQQVFLGSSMVEQPAVNR